MIENKNLRELIIAQMLAHSIEDIIPSLTQLRRAREERWWLIIIIAITHVIITIVMYNLHQIGLTNLASNQF